MDSNKPQVSKMGGTVGLGQDTPVSPVDPMGKVSPMEPSVVMPTTPMEPATDLDTAAVKPLVQDEMPAVTPVQPGADMASSATTPVSPSTMGVGLGSQTTVEPTVEMPQVKSQTPSVGGVAASTEEPEEGTSGSGGMGGTL